jgi:hypothetical protein
MHDVFPRVALDLDTTGRCRGGKKVAAPSRKSDPPPTEGGLGDQQAARAVGELTRFGHRPADVDRFPSSSMITVNVHPGGYRVRSLATTQADNPGQHRPPQPDPAATR